jgi:hypothetical protein
MKAREEAQLLDLIPTSPEGAVRDERVDPATQSDAADPKLYRQAIRNGWAVPEDKKPVIVDEMVKLVETIEVDAHVRVAAARTLRAVDRDQWERDHPELAGKAKGSVNVTQGQQVNLLDMAREAATRPDPLEAAKQVVEEQVKDKADG